MTNLLGRNRLLLISSFSPSHCEPVIFSGEIASQGNHSRALSLNSHLPKTAHHRRNIPSPRQGMARPIPKGNLPDLVLQEVHVPIQQCVGRGENAHGLHAGTTLQLTLHRHVGKAGQAKTEPFPEITGDKGLTEGSMLKRRRKKGN